MAMPITVAGAPTAATARSSVGESSLARPTTATSETSSRAKLAQAVFSDGGGACADSSAAPRGGRK